MTIEVGEGEGMPAKTVVAGMRVSPVLMVGVLRRLRTWMRMADGVLPASRRVVIEAATAGHNLNPKKHGAWSDKRWCGYSSDGRRPPKQVPTPSAPAPHKPPSLVIYRYMTIGPSTVLELRCFQASLALA